MDPDGDMAEPVQRALIIFAHMCFQTQLVLAFTKGDAYWNKTILDEVQQRAHFHHASVFARDPWPVITAEEPDRVQDMQCGYVPGYVDDAPAYLKTYSTYNAKSEEMYAKRTFAKAAADGRRCLIPVTGFFEWMHVGKEKYPFFIHKRGGGLFMLGGIHGNGTFSILTTEANARMAEIHNSKKRMPVIIPQTYERDWLNPALSEADVHALCAPAPNDYLEDWPVSKLITTRGVDTNVPAVWKRFSYPALDPASDPTASLFPG